MNGMILDALTRSELRLLLREFLEQRPESGDDFESKFCKSLLRHLKTRELSAKQMRLLQEILLRYPEIVSRLTEEFTRTMISPDTPIKSSSSRRKKLPEDTVKKDHVWSLYTDLYGAVETLSDRDALEGICADFNLELIEKAFIDAEQGKKGFRWVINRLYLSQNQKDAYGKRQKNYRKSQRKTGKKSGYYGQFFTRL